MKYHIEVRAKGDSQIPTMPDQKDLHPEKWKKTENTYMNLNGYDSLGELFKDLNKRPENFPHGICPERVEYRIVREDREVFE